MQDKRYSEKFPKRIGLVEKKRKKMFHRCTSVYSDVKCKIKDKGELDSFQVSQDNDIVKRIFSSNSPGGVSSGVTIVEHCLCCLYMIAFKKDTILNRYCILDIFRGCT